LWREEALMDSLTTTQVLPISGCVAVFAHQPDGRSVLELFGPAGQLLAVFSNSLVDSSPLRGGWRGAAGGSWAIAIGLQVGGGDTTVRFHGKKRLLGPGVRVQLPAVALGDFWVAEAAGAFTSVQVVAAERETGTRLTPVDRLSRS
jgi:hypothetical protein